jgi:hypothetical protein
MTVLLESPPRMPREDIPPPAEPPTTGGDRRPEPLPVWFAVTVVVLLAVGLTYIGMLTQIWANLSGAQLPGA